MYVYIVLCVVFFFFFKQKTAYEIKECDWSSDVCSSDLRHELDMEIKAITYHGLKVERDGDGWLAEVIVDI